MTHRYLKVQADDLREINRLLTKGWKPVRETSLDSLSETNSQQALVLVESAGGPIAFSELPEIHDDFLREISLLDGFSPKEYRSFCQNCKLMEFQEKEIIFKEGEENRTIYIVVEGEVCIRISGLPVEEMQITDIGRGAVFGESSFFSPSPHVGTAQCVKPVKVMQFSRETYDELAASHTLWVYKLAENAAEILAANLQNTDQWVWELLREGQSAEVTRNWHRYRDRFRGQRFGS